MKINNEKEKQKFLELNIKGVGSYALVTYNNQTEVIWIANIGKSFTKDNNIWFLEAPCEIIKYNFDLNDKEDLKHVKEYGYIIKNGTVYEIDSSQTAPFLPDVLDDLTLISKEYCLDWMLRNNKIK